MASWFNTDATELRTFLADLIEAEVIETIEEVVSFCDNPRRYNDLYNQWIANGRQFDPPEEIEVGEEEEEEEE